MPRCQFYNDISRSSSDSPAPPEFSKRSLTDWVFLATLVTDSCDCGAARRERGSFQPELPADSWRSCELGANCQNSTRPSSRNAGTRTETHNTPQHLQQLSSSSSSLSSSSSPLSIAYSLYCWLWPEDCGTTNWTAVFDNDPYKCWLMCHFNPAPCHNCHRCHHSQGTPSPLSLLLPH